MRVKVFLNIEGSRLLLGVLNDDGIVSFQYSPSFLKSGLEPSPISVPLTASVWHSKNHLNDDLPGFIADSLPDGWGRLLLDRQLRRTSKRIFEIGPLLRLSWVGRSGMGALEYEPEKPLEDFSPESIHLDSLADNVESILSEKETLEALDTLVDLNGSSAGARPKIVCLVSQNFKEIKRGQEFEKSFSPWIIKFRQSDDSKDTGAQEYICSLIARDAGIEMPQTHLFESKKGPGWFGIERFDRTPLGKLHMVTVSGLLDCDFRQPCLDYQTLMVLSNRLSGKKSVVEMFRRAVFNYSIGNFDDHAKNFSFLMNQSGQWRLAPAYDLVPCPSAVNEHMTSVNGLGRNVSRKEFLRLASKFDIQKEEAVVIMDEIAEAVSKYPELTLQYGIKRLSFVNPI